MNEDASSNFGILIAYLIPGAIVLLGLTPFSPLLQGWFASSPPDAPSIGGFLFLTVAALAAGMTVGAVRWAIVDSFHAWSGLPVPDFDFSKLGPNVEAFRLLIEIHYRHYQFYANSGVATAFAYVSHRISLGFHGSWGWLDLGVAFLEVVFFVTSRDTLHKYYHRSRQLLR